MKSAALRAKCDAVRQLSGLLHAFEMESPLVERFLQEYCVLLQPRRGELLIRKGDICDQYFFIIKGVLRGYTDYAGSQITTWISVENDLVTSIYSLADQQPVFENIEALEQSSVLMLKAVHMEQLYELYPALNKTARLLLSRYYRDAEMRAFMARIPDAASKYLFFINRYPHLANTIPIKYIASYLGIRQETLSRIRSGLSRHTDAGRTNADI
jgi:CRP-like cAMP-binding protein